MKKILLFSTIALGSILANAQVISDDDFNSADFTVGHISEAGHPALGQKDWQIASDIKGTSLDDFKIETLNGRKVASVIGTSTAAGSKFLLKDSFKKGWDNRTEFNDILSLEADVFTGTANANAASYTFITILGVNPKGDDTIINRFYINHKDLSLGIVLYTNVCDINPQDPACTKDPNKDIGTWAYNLATLPANTWLKVGLAWDYNSGEVFYKVINASTGQELANYQLIGALPNSVINQINVNTYNDAVSTSVGKTVLGSFKVYASDVVDLLAVNNVTKVKVDLTLFPNPTSDFLNINTKSKVEAAQIYDMSGKSISNSTVLDNKVDVRNLSKGTYIIKVKTVEGETTQKFIKN